MLCYLKYDDDTNVRYLKYDDDTNVDNTVVFESVLLVIVIYHSCCIMLCYLKYDDDTNVDNTVVFVVCYYGFVMNLHCDRFCG